MSHSKVGLWSVFVDHVNHGSLCFIRRDIGNHDVGHLAPFPIPKRLPEEGDHRLFREIPADTENRSVGMDRRFVKGDQIFPLNPLHWFNRAFARHGMAGTIQELDEFAVGHGLWLILASADPFDGLQFGELDAFRLECRCPYQSSKKL